MADVLANLDPAKLVSIGAAVAFAIYPFFEGPSYNFPLFLFGVYVQENSEAIQSLRLFTGLLGTSIIWDILWLFRHIRGFFWRVSLIVVILLKIPTFFAFSGSMRQRGAHFGGIGIGGGDTLWSMPGGWSSGGQADYRPVDDRVEAQRAPPATHGVPPPPTTGSGGPQAPGAYQSV